VIAPVSIKKQILAEIEKALDLAKIKARAILRGEIENRSGFTDEQLADFADFAGRKKLVIDALETKDIEKNLHHPNAILIVGYSGVQNILKSPNGHAFDTMILDEAQMVHKPKTNISKELNALIKSQTMDTFKSLFVTATPFENDFSELWTLLSIANPELYPNEVLIALDNLLGNIVDQLKDSACNDDVKIDPDHLILAFAHCYRMKSIFEKMVIYKDKKMEEVREDWTEIVDGEKVVKLPVRKKVKVDLHLEQDILNTLESLSKRNLGQADEASFVLMNKVSKLLLHP
jgi:hypothetical protein